MPEKTCTKCKEVKSLEEFHRRKLKFVSWCKSCRKVQTRNRYENMCEKRPKRGRAKDTTQVEADAIELLTKILRKHLDVRRVSEWCLADMCVRPLSSCEDKWLMIQVKTTRGKGPLGYQFPLRKSYPNCLVLLVSLEDSKIWNIDNRTTATTLTIGKESKYDEFLLKNNEEDLFRIIRNWKGDVFTLNEINTPVNENHKVERVVCKSSFKFTLLFRVSS
jgi:hypothetical protein